MAADAGVAVGNRGGQVRAFGPGPRTCSINAVIACRSRCASARIAAALHLDPRGLRPANRLRGTPDVDVAGLLVPQCRAAPDVPPAAWSGQPVPGRARPPPEQRADAARAHRRAATCGESGDGSHLDTYLTKTLDYRMPLFCGSPWESSSWVGGGSGTRAWSPRPPTSPALARRCGSPVTTGQARTTSGWSVKGSCPNCWPPTPGSPGPPHRRASRRGRRPAAGRVGRPLSATPLDGRHRPG